MYFVRQRRSLDDVLGGFVTWRLGKVERPRPSGKNVSILLSRNKNLCYFPLIITQLMGRRKTVLPKNFDGEK